VNFKRRDFLKYSALFLTSAIVNPKQVFSSSNFGNQKNELHMLMLGDSIMWGQGLLTEQKFWFLTKQWLEKRTGKTVVPHVEAHSGATILWRNDQKYPLDRLSTFNGELNLSTPTIEQQVANAAKHYGMNSGLVDLVLVNGGINDFQILNFVNYFRSKGWVEKRCRQIFGEDMFLLLEKIQKSFGNARIVVTGYYPIISMDTDPEHLCSLLKNILDEKFVNRILRFFRIKESSLDLCPTNLVKNLLDKLLVKLSGNSEIWKSQSDIYLGKTINDFNKKYPLNSIAANNNPRAIFVKAPFGIKNAYAAYDTNLWQITLGGQIFGKYKSNDNFYELRGEYVCRCNHIKLKGFNLEKCAIAGTGHPNIKGASEYAKAIEQELGKVLELTK
jgi:hypothetical protein